MRIIVLNICTRLRQATLEHRNGSAAVAFLLFFWVRGPRNEIHVVESGGETRRSAVIGYLGGRGGEKMMKATCLGFNSSLSHLCVNVYVC